MARGDINVRMRNYARGGEDYHALRWRIAHELLESSAEAVEDLAPFHANALFSLEGRSFHCLKAFDRDWPVLEKIARARTQNTDYNYLLLVAHYILVNRRSVAKLYDFSLSASRGILEQRYDDVVSMIYDLGPLERQSLAAFRLLASLNASNQQIIADYFHDKPHAEWVRQRFLYPLVFHAINIPSDSYFDQLLDQVFSHYHGSKAQHVFIKLLLRDEIQCDLSLAFKAYAGLLCHPYDAAEILINHIEREVASGTALPNSVLGILELLAEALPYSRLPGILRIAKKVEVEVREECDTPAAVDLLGLTGPWATLLQSYAGVEPREDLSAGTDLASRMWRMRWNRYPIRDDFTLLTTVAERYSYTDAGRLLDTLLTSLFMVERRSKAVEMRDLLRQYCYYGALTAFLLSSPRGGAAMEAQFFTVGDDADLENMVTTYAANPSHHKTRGWMKAFHWQIRVLEREMRVAAWLGEVRSAMPISVNQRYLSGIDWAWVDRVIEATKIAAFRGSSEGVYALFLRYVEQRQRESNPLQIAMKPFQREHGTLRRFVPWLSEEYGASAIAIVRLYLTPEMILKLGLERRYTAALTERLAALESLVKTYGFVEDILTEAQFEQEEKTLSTALSLMDVGANQFELSWGTLKQDAALEVEDAYNTYIALTRGEHPLSLLSDVRKRTHQSFINKQVRRYELRNRDWPLAMVVFGVIDTFLAHPSFGIESILAVRIRHDNFRREYARALSLLKQTNMKGVPAGTRRDVIEQFEEPIYRTIRKWVSAYMHTRRPGLDTGVFEFTPDQHTLSRFIDEVGEGAELDHIITVVMEWLSECLEEQLRLARESLTDGLKRELTATVQRTAEQLVSSGQVEEACCARVAPAILTAVQVRSDELLDWFCAPTAVRDIPITLERMKLAVEARFEAEITGGQLLIDRNVHAFFQHPVPPEHVRQMFDLWTELVHNAVKYSRFQRVRVRITVWQQNDISGLIFSSLWKGESRQEKVIEGHPYRSVSEAIFADRKSGQNKVAYLAASLLRDPTEIRIIAGRGAYHVIVPITRGSASTGG